MHGSVNYVAKDGGKFVGTDGQVQRSDFYGRGVKQRLMVFPAGEKYTARSPYYEYLVQLRQTVTEAQVCIVVGYTFRDAEINHAFLDWVQKNPKLRILLAGTSASKVKSSMDNELQRNVLA